MLGETQELIALIPGSYAIPQIESQESHDSERDRDAYFDTLTKRQAYYLFMSHTLSMWNSRTYEFAVVRFSRASLEPESPDVEL